MRVRSECASIYDVPGTTYSVSLYLYLSIIIGVGAVRLQKKLRFDFGIRNDVTFRVGGPFFSRTVGGRRIVRSNLQSSASFGVLKIRGGLRPDRIL